MGSNRRDRIRHERFRTTWLTPELLERIGGHIGRLHFMLRRGVFYSHKNLDLVLDRYEENGRFVLFTGRGPFRACTVRAPDTIDVH